MREMVLTGLLACAALAVFAAAAWHVPRLADRPIAAITAITTRYAPEGARSVTATVNMRASDPAVVRIYTWPADVAGEAEAHLAAHEQLLGSWALRAVASMPVEPGASHVSLAAPAFDGWLYAIAIEPLSQQHGGTFQFQRADLDFGR